ncbi:MAG: hypothetical protein JNM81_01380 [Rhodospirillaceae bacterium]|nr:hypothetical protein [Rhodospirillaceae bacterium]
MANAAFETAQREALREERRRLARSRRFLQAALTNPAPQWPDTVAFFQACVGYLEVATKRLIAQDVSLARQLRAVLPASHVDDHAFLNELEDRLTERAGELQQLVDATAVMAKGDQGGLEKFRADVDYFFNAPSTKRSRPQHSMPPLIEAYGSPDVWTNAQADADACGSEFQAYQVIEQRMLPGLPEIVAAVEAQAKAQP